MDALRSIRNHCAIAFILSQPPDETKIRPSKYLSAIHEIFVFALAVCWVVGLIWTPDKIFKHPARGITWHLNPCFGWDYPPASYIAIVLISTNVYWSWTYAWLQSARTRMIAKKRDRIDRFAIFSVNYLAFACNLGLLLWVIGPYTPDWTAHTLIFLNYAVASYVAHLANFLEASKGSLAHKVERKHRVFLATYTVAIILVPACYATLGLAGDGDPDTAPPVHPVITHCIDLFWLAHMLVEQSFTPPEQPLLMTLRVDEAEKSKQAVAPAGIEHQA